MCLLCLCGLLKLTQTASKFDRLRSNKHFEEKKLEVYYLIEKEIIITVTVYVFYGKF
jgi:hypothetical protein